MMPDCDIVNPAEGLRHSGRATDSRLAMHEKQRSIAAFTPNERYRPSRHRSVEDIVGSIHDVPKLKIATCHRRRSRENYWAATGIRDADNRKWFAPRKRLRTGSRRREDELQHVSALR